MPATAHSLPADKIFVPMSVVFKAVPLAATRNSFPWTTGLEVLHPAYAESACYCPGH